MKLGILCTMTNGFGRKGFYNTQEIGLGRALWRMGHKVTVYKCLLRGETQETAALEDGFRICYLRMPSIGAHALLNTRVLDRDLDGLLCFADNQLFLPHVVRFCRKHGIVFVPYIGTTHSLYAKSLKGRLSDALLMAGSMRCYRGRPILAKTVGAREELAAMGFQDVTLAPVGLDDGVLCKTFAEADRAALRREYGGFSPEDVVICSVSRLEPEKRPLELIDLLYRIRDRKPFRLLLVGEGSLEQPVREKVSQLGLEDRVCLLPRVPYNEMWKIYTLSDYFVNLNRGEIFGMAIMEAVYYEASVAASRAPGPSLTLRDMPGHCLCDSDDEIAAWLTAPGPEQARLRESSRKMLREFSWQRCADAFASLAARGSQAAGRNGS